MVWKLTILIISIASLAQAIEYKNLEYKEEDHYAPAKYEFHYAVHDPHTGDIKSQKEARNGDKVEGVYELIEPDGHKRTVHYSSDHHTGFQAVVHREPTNIKIPIPEQHHKLVAHKIVAHAPLVHYSHAPEIHYAKAEPQHHGNYVHVATHDSEYKY